MTARKGGIEEFRCPHAAGPELVSKAVKGLGAYVSWLLYIYGHRHESLHFFKM